MKIIYLHQYFLTPKMSGGTRSYEFARRLVDKGHEVHVVTSRSQRADRGQVELEQIDGINVHWLTVPYSNKMSFRRRIFAFVRFAVMAARHARRLDGDVVFATSTPLTIAIPGSYAAWRLKIPMVFEVRDLWPETPIAIGALRDPVSKFLARRLERFAYARSARIVALSPDMADGVEDTGYPPDRIDMIPNASDLSLMSSGFEGVDSFLQSIGPINRKALVVYTGTLGYVPGVSYLVRVARESLDMGLPTQFLIVGDGAERESIVRLAGELGVLGQNLWWHEPVPKDTVPVILAAASLATSLVVDIPELWKNSANKFFDALASGTPVAINYQGWHAALIQENKNGLVLPPKDFRAAAAEIDKFLGNSSAVQAAGLASRQLAEREFDRDLLAQKLERSLISAVEEARR